MRGWHLGLLVSFVLVACGGGKKPPEATEPLKNEAGVETFGEVNASDLAELDAGALNSAAPAATAASPPSPAPVDDCTPVGVDFEKRARPKLKDCYATGKKKDANLQGTVKIAVEIQAENEAGFDDNLQRAVKENCKVLKFKSAEFEQGE